MHPLRGCSDRGLYWDTICFICKMILNKYYQLVKTFVFLFSSLQLRNVKQTAQRTGCRGYAAKICNNALKLSYITLLFPLLLLPKALKLASYLNHTRASCWHFAGPLKWDTRRHSYSAAFLTCFRKPFLAICFPKIISLWEHLLKPRVRAKGYVILKSWQGFSNRAQLGKCLQVHKPELPVSTYRPDRVEWSVSSSLKNIHNLRIFTVEQPFCYSYYKLFGMCGHNNLSKSDNNKTYILSVKERLFSKRPS